MSQDSTPIREKLRQLKLDAQAWRDYQAGLKRKTDIRPGAQNILLKIAGKSYRCACGCNVFNHPDISKPELYQCNACEQEFEAT